MICLHLYRFAGRYFANPDISEREKEAPVSPLPWISAVCMSMPGPLLDSCPLSVDPALQNPQSQQNACRLVCLLLTILLLLLETGNADIVFICDTVNSSASYIRYCSQDVNTIECVVCLKTSYTTGATPRSAFYYFPANNIQLVENYSIILAVFA